MSEEKKVKKNKPNIEELEQKVGECMQGWQRAQADYQNLQKETDQWKQEFVQYAKADFILELLPVYNHYRTALDHVPEEDKDKDWVQGLQHIFKQLKTSLEKFKVKEIEALGKEFDHNVHEAVGQEVDKSKKEDIILKVVHPGYMLGEKVLQPVKVIVNNLDTKE